MAAGADGAAVPAGVVGEAAVAGATGAAVLAGVDGAAAVAELRGTAPAVGFTGFDGLVTSLSLGLDIGFSLMHGARAIATLT